MSNANFRIPRPSNEPVFPYAAGDTARTALQATIKELRSNPIEIPLIIGGKEIFTGDTQNCIEPHDHKSVIGKYHQATKEHALAAIQAAKVAKHEWENFAPEDRAAIFLKAADLLSTKYRYILNASTMLGQSKSCHQAEIDSACEFIDFLRFNAYYLEQIYNEQPDSVPGLWNRLEHRPLDGFVFAITPFNFTAIAGNLPCAPALMGNTVVWKPGETAVHSGYFIMQILQEAGLPDGVINFIPGPPTEVAPPILDHEDLGGVHFTGSTKVFQSIWKHIGNNIENYKSYPRIVGETGGKDFVFAHPSAEAPELATALVRGAFEYQGQKCSAASRAYIPQTLWNDVKAIMEEQLAEIKMGNVDNFSNFINAVIDERAFDKISGYIDRAKNSQECEIIFGGEYSKETGYFVQPTVIQTTNPKYESMVEEIFGPVLTVFVYDENNIEETLELCDTSSAYALTGAVFSKDRSFVRHAMNKLRYSAGNFYINDKPTGAVVGQQPFGGSRASGTNDKAGSPLNLIRWVSPRTIKETFVPPTSYRYPFLDELL